MNSDPSCSTVSRGGEVTEEESGLSATSWIAAFELRKLQVVASATSSQKTLDPEESFECLPESQKARLTKALFRFFLMKQGLAPSLPIPREDVVRIFETARREGNLASTPKLFNYFLQETRKKLAETFGLEIKEVEKRSPSEDAKKRKTAKPLFVFYVFCLLPAEIRRQFMEPREAELLAMMGLLVRLLLASEGKLTKAEIIELLHHLGMQEGVYHEVFGEWEKVIFDEALKRRYLISSRAVSDHFELGEAAFLEIPETDFTHAFTERTS